MTDLNSMQLEDLLLRRLMSQPQGATPNWLSQYQPVQSQPYLTPGDVGAFAARQMAPNAVNYLTGQGGAYPGQLTPQGPSQPAADGKIPSTSSNLPFDQALGDALQLGIGMVGPPVKGVAAAAAPLVAGIAKRGASVASPAIKKAETLFDYSKLRDVPDVPQFNLERYEPPRGVPDYIEAVGSKKNVARVNEVVKQGEELGGREWYNTEPLRQAFIAELGAEKGQVAYNQYLDMVAATSPRSNVGTNARNASYYYGLAQRGEPLPTTTKKGNNWSLDEPLPSPYGHIAQALHIQNARNVLSEGGWPVLQNPKPASFAQNLQGNQMPITSDAHNVRLFGVTDAAGKPLDKPPKTGYGFLERLQQEQAAKLGMSPAQYQASAWIGGGEQTGLRSSADPFLKVLEDRIAKTADARNMTKAEVLKQFIRGKMPLLSGAGAATTLELHELSRESATQ